MLQRNTIHLIGTFFIAMIVCSSCYETPKADDKDISLVKKENELLKKENELLKKEKELNQISTRPVNEPATMKESQSNSQIVDNLEYLKKFNGKYPYDIQLFSNPTLTRRLKRLLNGRYKFLEETWAVETPIEINNNTFVASGCEQHNCASTNFIIVVDFSKNVLYAGVREEDVVKVYSEDGSSNPEIIKWANNS